MAPEAEIVKVVDYTNFLISVLSVIVAPIIAVWVAQKLQNRVNERRDKMLIFSSLMMYRGLSHVDAVKAYNMIDIVFADSKKVREQWATYYRVLSATPYDLESAKKENFKLLECLAEDLGYKNKITWESIQYPYYPQWLGQAIDKNEKYIDAQTSLAEIIKNINPDMVSAFLHNLFASSMAKQEERKEDDK